MKANEFVVLQYLDKNDRWVNAHELSLLLNVSPRQIRSYISSINSKRKIIVHSSANGYKLNKSLFNEVKGDIQAGRNEDMNNDERIILKIITHKEGIEISEIADNLFLGYSTIENYLNLIRKEISPYGLKLRKKKELVWIEGLEANKRRLIHKLFRDNTANFSFMEGIEHILNINIDIKEFQREIKQIISRHRLFINDYALSNIVIHLLIAMDRAKNKSTLESTFFTEVITRRDTTEYETALEIIDFINKSVAINIQDDSNALEKAIECSTSSFNYNKVTKYNISEYVNPKYVHITNDLIADINSTFFLEINAEEFIPSFSIHIQNLFKRTILGYSTQNPLTNSIKSNYPLVYNISVFIAQTLINKYDIDISEDEISYFAIHVGGHLETTNKYRNQTKTVFVYMEYYNIHFQNIERIQEELGDQIYLEKAIPVDIFVAEDFIDYLIITSTALNLDHSYHSVEVSTFVSDADIKQIRTIINRIKNNTHQKKANKIITRFFREDLFFTDTYRDDEDQYIQFLSGETEKLRLTDKDFCDQVIQRESISSTSFIDGVAVPHSLTLSAKQSFIATIKNTTESKWGDHKVKLIFLVGISKEDGKDFRVLFDYIIEQLINPVKLHSLLQTRNYNEFIDRLLEL